MKDKLNHIRIMSESSFATVIFFFHLDIFGQTDSCLDPVFPIAEIWSGGQLWPVLQKPLEEPHVFSFVLFLFIPSTFQKARGSKHSEGSSEIDLKDKFTQMIGGRVILKSSNSIHL